MLTIKLRDYQVRRNFLHITALFLSVFIFFTAHHAAFPATNSALQRKIDKLIDSVDPNVNIGIEISNLNSGEILYQYNENRTFVPASNLKLFTSAAALLYLGPQYRFINQLLTDPIPIENGTLAGNVYLKLSGDPSLTSLQLKELIEKMKDKNIHTVEGDFIIDASAKQTQPYGPGWMLEDTLHGYGAQIAPLIVDQNSIHVMIKPGAYPYQLAQVEVIAPATPYIQLHNQLKTTKDNENCTVSTKMYGPNVLNIDGCIDVNAPVRTKVIPLHDPFYYGKEMIADALKDNNIALNGSIKKGQIPVDSKAVAKIESSPLSELTLKVLKNSNNLYADAIFLKLAEENAQQPAEWKAGTHAIKEILKQQLDLDLSHSIIVDGSGLSRYNLVSPHQIIGLLSHMYNKFPVVYEYIAALPVAGRDGTLEKRLRLNQVQGNIRAKTGTMSGVVSLSGYLTTADQQILAFSIMINGFTKPVTKYQQLADSIVSYLSR